MSKYKIVPTGRFKQDSKIARKRGYNLALLATIVDTLAQGYKLPDKYKDH